MGDEPDLVLVYGKLGDVEFLEKLVQCRKVIATVVKWWMPYWKAFYAVPIYRVARRVSKISNLPSIGPQVLERHGCARCELSSGNK